MYISPSDVGQRNIPPPYFFLGHPRPPHDPALLSRFFALFLASTARMSAAYPGQEDDTASDSSFEDGQHSQSVPLLPFQAWSPSAFKEKFMHSSPQLPHWSARFPLPPVVRRRWVLLSLLGLAAIGCIPILLSGSLGSRQEERIAQPGSFNPQPPQPEEALNPVGAQEWAEMPEDALPVHLRPDTFLEGLVATSHFRGERAAGSTTSVTLTNVFSADSLRNDTGYITSFLSAGWSKSQSSNECALT